MRKFGRMLSDVIFGNVVMLVNAVMLSAVVMCGNAGS